MAFSADELRVLRRALAQALQPSIPTGNTPGDVRTIQDRLDSPDIQAVQDVRDLLRLAEALEEAAREGGRLRTFESAELVRYRAALPGSAAGYLERLRGALGFGYVPRPDDLAALRRLRGQCCTPAEEGRRTALLRRCEHVAELDVRARLNRRVPAPGAPFAPRPRLLALPGGRDATASEPGNGDKGTDKGQDKGRDKGRDKGAGKEKRTGKEKEEQERGNEKEKGKGGKGNGPATTEPGRRVPTPAEIWPPRRRPAPPEEPREPRKPAPPPEQQRRGA